VKHYPVLFLCIYWTFFPGFPEDDPWNPSQEVLDIARRYLSQVKSVLERPDSHMERKDKMFIHITWSQPHFRRKLLENSNLFRVDTVKTVGGDVGFEYFLYLCKLI
jgi:hypothetical protein